MERWGIPQRIRFDNGSPWGTQSVVPSALGLWLVGLGIALTYGRPACSTDNAVVERCHRLLVDWAEPEQCSSFSQCQQHLNWAVDRQRALYPAVNGCSRLQAYPQLLTNPRRYRSQQDARLWDSQRVAAYLAQFIFQRKVEKYGQVSLFANSYSLGRCFARQIVEIRFDAHQLDWVFYSTTGQFLRRLPARELSYDLISQLRLGKRRK